MMIGKTKILESTWFGSVIGIVKIQTEDGRIEHYIGIGRGYDQKMDENIIADWGTCFDPEEIARFCGGSFTPTERID